MMKLYCVYMLAAHLCELNACRYLAAKSEADHYARELKREQEEIIAVPDIGLVLCNCLSSKPLTIIYMIPTLLQTHSHSLFYFILFCLIIISGLNFKSLGLINILVINKLPFYIKHLFRTI